MADTIPRCSFDVNHGAEAGGRSPCGRAMVGKPPAYFCPVHDRILCTAAVLDLKSRKPTQCGYRLVKGTEERCPQCSMSVRLADVLKRP